MPDLMSPTADRSPQDSDKSVPLRKPIIEIQIGGVSLFDYGYGPLIEGLRIEKDLKKINYAEVYVRNQSPQITDSILWRSGLPMLLFIGRYGRPEQIKLHGAYAMTQPKFEFKGRGRIVLAGYGEGISLTRIQRRRVFSGKTYEQIVKQVASDNQLDVIVQSDFLEEIPSITQAGINDFEFLTELAYRAGLDFYVKDGAVNFVKHARRANEFPVTIDVSMPGINSAIFSIDSDGDAAELVSSPVNPLVGTFPVIESEFNPDNFLDIDKDSEIRFEELVPTKVIYLDGRGNLLSQTSIRNMLDADANDRKLIVKVNVSMEGDESFTTRGFVDFIGVGQRFLGPYYVTKVTHRVSGMSFTTDFEAVRASTGLYRQAESLYAGPDIGGTPENLQDVSYRSRLEV